MLLGAVYGSISSNCGYSAMAHFRLHAYHGYLCSCFSISDQADDNEEPISLCVGRVLAWYTCCWFFPLVLLIAGRPSDTGYWSQRHASDDDACHYGFLRTITAWRRNGFGYADCPFRSSYWSHLRRLIIGILSWRWIFFSIVPIILIGVVWALHSMEQTTVTEKIYFDCASVVLSIVGFGGFVLWFRKSVFQKFVADLFTYYIHYRDYCSWSIRFTAT